MYWYLDKYHSNEIILNVDSRAVKAALIRDEKNTIMCSECWSPNVTTLYFVCFVYTFEGLLVYLLLLFN